MVIPSRGSDDHEKIAVLSPSRDVKTVSSISTFVLDILLLKLALKLAVIKDTCNGETFKSFLAEVSP